MKTQSKITQHPANPVFVERGYLLNTKIFFSYKNPCAEASVSLREVFF